MTPTQLPRVLDASGLRRLGISADHAQNEVYRQRWRRLTRGVLLTRPDEPTRSDWVSAGLLAGGPSAAVSGWDALRCYGLVRGTPPSEWVLILCTRGGSRDLGLAHLRRVRGPLGARRASIDDAMLPLARIAVPARAIADTSPCYSRDGDVRAVVSAAVQRGLCSPDELTAALTAAARRGSAGLRRSLRDVSDGARSEAEIRALRQLRTSEVPPFELNIPIVDARGRIVAVADFIWRRLRAILEIDSREYHFSETDWKRTIDRHNRLTSLGFAVIHYPPSRICEGSTWTDEVARWLRSRARELEQPFDVRPIARPGGRPLVLPT